MRRALAVAVLAAACTAHADPIERVVTGGARYEAGALFTGGLDSAGVTAFIDREDLNRMATVAYVYRWRGLASSTGSYRTLLRTPHLGLYFRRGTSLDVITLGGTAVGAGLDFGLGLRAGTASGSFSVVATPFAGADGFWVIREGRRGASARLPVGGELGLEGNVDMLVLCAAVRQFVDLWPGRSAAYRFQAYAGAGVRFDLPGKREKGKPEPSGP